MGRDYADTLLLSLCLLSVSQDKIRSGGITPEETEEFKKMIAELSADHE
jgi:hypothetical protein